MENVVQKLSAKSEGKRSNSNQMFASIAMMAAAKSESSKNTALKTVEMLRMENKALKEKIGKLEQELKSVKIELFDNPLMGNIVDRIHGL